MPNDRHAPPIRHGTMSNQMPTTKSTLVLLRWKTKMTRRIGEQKLGETIIWLFWIETASPTGTFCV